MHQNITNIFIGQYSIRTTAIHTEDVIFAVNLLNRYNIFTARKRSLRRLCFHRCLSVHKRKCLPHCMLAYTLSLPHWDQRQTPPMQTSPGQCMLGYGQQAGGTYPTGMHSCWIRNYQFDRKNSIKISTVLWKSGDYRGIRACLHEAKSNIKTKIFLDVFASSYFC